MDNEWCKIIPSNWNKIFKKDIIRLLKNKKVVSDKFWYLENIHNEILDNSLLDYDFNSGVNGITKELYDVDDSFMEVYYSFIKYLYKTLNFNFYFQATPTIRVHCPKAKNEHHYPRYHNDVFYGHPPEELNIWFSLTQNRSITISEDFVRKYCYKNLGWKLLSSHGDISLDFISDLRLDVDGSSTRPKWHSWELSKRKDLTMGFITKFKDCNFNWNAIVKNEHLPLESLINLLENLGKTQWGFWYYLSLRDDISEEIIEKYPLKRWNWWWISKNKNINIDIVKRYPNWNWDWAYLPVNPNITLQIIKDDPEFSCNLKNITSNLTNKMINEWIDKNRNKYISVRWIHRFWCD